MHTYNPVTKANEKKFEAMTRHGTPPNIIIDNFSHIFKYYLSNMPLHCENYTLCSENSFFHISMNDVQI